MVVDSEEDTRGLSWLQYYGEELTATRELKGLSVRELAALTSYSHQQIYNVEAGRRPPTEVFTREVDLALDTGGRFARILRRVLSDPFPDWFRGATREEQLATKIRIYQAQVVPGLLQIEGYARSLMQAARPRESVGQIEIEVAARIGRQSILTGENPPMLWVVVDESVLLRPIGGPTVMSEQLERLLDAGESPGIVVQVVPLNVGSHAGLDGSFTLWSYDDREDVLYSEGMLSGRIVEQRSDVMAAHLAYDLLAAVALSPAKSLDLIRSALKDST